MNRQIIGAIVRKDVKAVFSSTQTWLPMIIVPLVFMIMIPVGLIILGLSVDLAAAGGGNFDIMTGFLSNLPESGVKTEIAGFDSLNQKIVYLALDYLFIPMFLIIPVMVSSIIAANSFAGEKERKTLETLLYTPASEFELFFGKILASLIPAIAVSLLGFLLYGTIIDTLGYALFGKLVFPTLNWLFVMFWLIPAVSILAIFINVYVSAKVKGFQDAQQISALLVLPLLALMFAQIGGIVFFDSLVIIAAGVGLFVLDLLLIRLAVKSFNREVLFKTQIN